MTKIFHSVTIISSDIPTYRYKLKYSPHKFNMFYNNLCGGKYPAYITVKNNNSFSYQIIHIFYAKKTYQNIMFNDNK